MTASMMLFTRDLRVTDNPALTAAARQSSTVPLFALDEDLLKRCRWSANRLGFLLESLRDLDARLKALGGALVIRRGQWVAEVIGTARAAGASTIHVADDVSAYARARLARLEQAAQQQRLTVVRHPGITAVGAGTLGPPGSSAYQVFTPYYNRWREAPRRALAPEPARICLPGGLDPGRVPDLSELTSAARSADLLPGGESAGLARLAQWARTGVADYERARDELATDRSSRLSPYLHLGCLSARTVETDLSGLPSGESFVRQIAWRDFFHQILAARPEAAWRDYRDRGDQWNADDGALEAWAAGQTGYPVVDAGMRQLAAEGFMHNRARMIVASFLTKDLYIDWRRGAAHFMALLLDGDVACNQLNWQWVAGTGTDTNPHRIFNPTTQGRRFDPGGGYVRRYVPELAALPAASIQDPDAAARKACGYPAPLVDHRAAIAGYRARRRGGPR
ncbi:MAG: cryptochrome/photolyase family protein [Streptosporangiaceae bacterium]|jgi:deoxyribodipyrimidine photo-lyase